MRSFTAPDTRKAFKELLPDRFQKDKYVEHHKLLLGEQNPLTNLFCFGGGVPSFQNADCLFFFAKNGGMQKQEKFRCVRSSIWKSDLRFYFLHTWHTRSDHHDYHQHHRHHPHGLYY